MLLTLLIVPIICSIGLMFQRSIKFMIGWSLILSFLTFVQSLVLIIVYDNTINSFQFNLMDKFAIDGISLWMIFLINLLMPIVILSIYPFCDRRMIFMFQVLSFWSNAVFIVTDLLWFYISFEAVLLPMYYIITNYGSRNKTKGIHASYLFVIYTLFGSLFLFAGLLILYIESGTLNYEILLKIPININYQYILWLAFFICFAVKLPIIPFHIWLLTAHVEGSTSASVILAAILLKFGSYGLIRYNIALFPLATYVFQPIIYTAALLSIFYSSIAALSQIDLKLIIAYSSIGHVGTTILGLFSNDLLGIQAGIIFMISHGFISSALFLLVGIIYDRYHTRTIIYYRGLSLIFPIFTSILVFFSMANSGFPLTSGFIAEFIALYGIFNSNPLIAFLACFSIVLVPAFMLNLVHRISYGRLSNYINIITNDLTIKEYHIFIPLIIGTIIIGIYPEVIYDTCDVSYLLFETSQALISVIL